MAMFHECSFPTYQEGAGIVAREFVIRDDHYEDVLHDLVPTGVTLLVEDWSGDGFRDVVLRKQGCVWVVTELSDAPECLPDQYYQMKAIVGKNQEHKQRSHPWL
jgi:hypothetical protein